MDAPIDLEEYVFYYLFALLQKCDFSVQEFIEKKDKLIELIGKDDETLSMHEWGLHVGQCGDLTHAQLVTIINGVIEGLIHLREEGNQNDYDRARQQINNVIYPLVFDEHFGHAPPGHQSGGRRHRAKRNTRAKSNKGKCKTKKTKKTKRTYHK